MRKRWPGSRSLGSFPPGTCSTKQTDGVVYTYEVGGLRIDDRYDDRYFYVALRNDTKNG